MRTLAIRLAPGADLKAELERITRDEGLRAGVLLTGVGSLAEARLRMPGAVGAASTYQTFAGPLEIVSLAGTLGPEGLHIHIALSGPDGACVGGHLAERCLVHTTAELVIGDLDEVEFARVPDPQTGFRELLVRPRP